MSKKRVRVCITLPCEVAQELRNKQKRECMNVSAFVSKVLENALHKEIQEVKEQDVL